MLSYAVEIAGDVAPFAGARVETGVYGWYCDFYPIVAPFAGARVETQKQNLVNKMAIVAPFAGARVETLVQDKEYSLIISRSLRGSAS